MSYDALIRRKALEEIWQRASEEDRRMLVLMSCLEEENRRTRTAIDSGRETLENLRAPRPWIADFGTGVASNLLAYGLVWAAGRLL